ncbi:MAG TPA: penicillin-binding protein 1C [Bacteroidales bacterium]|nr:penicillin-binding protein 1C [Bacteroidales bacterium]
MPFKNIKTKHKIMLAGILLLLAFLLVPPVKFKNTTSTVLLDRNGQLLSATVSDEGMWQFPEVDTVPEKFAICLTQFEDAYFRYHLGVNPISVIRAMKQNIQARKIVSGASTITMQLVRLSRRGKPRTFWEKCIEMFLAVRTEFSYSKRTILAKYASQAPFGGNVVGLDAAAWRYFGTSPNNLSWAEAATLAILPNAPGLIFPGRNQDLLIKKRNRLLAKLKGKGYIDDETYQLALLEPAPNLANNLPQDATHLLTRCIHDGLKGKMVVSTIDKRLYDNAYSIALRYHRHFMANGIRNMAAMVIDNRTSEVLVYIGNILSNNPANSSMVDIIKSKRSYGSLLKPFLYGFMLNEGLLYPRQLVDDIPVAYSDFAPKNFSKTFEGMVPANEILSRSLNVPSVNLLRQYGIEKFHNNLQQMGVKSINKPPGHYGLSIILGGAEASMWELSGIYSALAKKAGNEQNSNVTLRYQLDSTTVRVKQIFNCSGIGSGAAYLTLEALTEANRPGEDGTWRHFISSQRIAWKTGTSYGFRDAWAIGVTPNYTVAVWVGNADGEGRADLIGVAAAAPVMFDIFSLLPASDWFAPPWFDLVATVTCKHSGLIASENCTDTIMEYVPAVKTKTLPCPYHQKIYVDKEQKYRLTLGCAKQEEMFEANWFVLPPAQEWFYSKLHAEYRKLPPFRKGCAQVNNKIPNIALIYPYAGADIYIPREKKDTKGHSIWKATHRNLKANIYWHLNDVFLGKTNGLHEMLVSPKPGTYTLTLVDDEGEVLQKRIRVIGE